MTVTTSEAASSDDNVRVEVYEADDVLAFDPFWTDRAPLGQYLQVRAIDALEPAEVHEDHNTTCVELDELRADALNPATTTNQATISRVHVGDGGTTPQYSNRSLNNFVVSVDVAEYETHGTDITLNAVVGTEQGNDAANDLQELGCVTGSGLFLNHSLFSPVNKTNNRAIVLEITLSFTNA